MADIITTETNETTSILAPIGTNTVSNIVEAVRNLPIMKEEDTAFLMEHSEHLGMVMENTFMWRTDGQKRSIINDLQHPTIHSKFHQAILEQKVQFDQAMYLAKDFEVRKLELEEKQCDLEDLDKDDLEHPENIKRNDIKRRKLALELNFMQYELKQMQISMKYRMAEVKGWQAIEEDLMGIMKEAGLSDEEIWHKDASEIEDLFFFTMNNLQGIAKTTDGGEYNNLVSLAAFAYKQALEANLLEGFKQKAEIGKMLPVLNSITFIEERFGYTEPKVK